MSKSRVGVLRPSLPHLPPPPPHTQRDLWIYAQLKVRRVWLV
jgi:hypothetical protein